MKEDITWPWCKRASELIDRGFTGKSIVLDLTAQVDNMLSDAFRMALLDFYSGGAPDDLALIAVGGYGRSEMVPYSDIDIMLLSRVRDQKTTESAQAVLYKFWDMGLNISHSFRTLVECLQDSVKDPKTRTAIIDSRFLIGDRTVFEEFRREIYPKILFKKKRDFVGDILAEVNKRHKTFDDSVYLLEPNIKEGLGGLRDVHTLTWLSKVILKIDDISGLTAIFAKNDYLHLIKAFDFFLKIRLSLHIVSKCRNDVLSFEFQDAVAQLMGFKNTKKFIAAEIMMRLYYKKSEAISVALKRIMNISGRKYIQFPLNLSIKKITADFYLARNEITVKDTGIFRDLDKIMEAFSIYSISGRKLSDHVQESIRGRALFISRGTSPSGKSVAAFLEILKGNRVYDTLRRMHEMGILDRFIPEFGRLRHLVIYEIYHRYTVDEHSLIAVKNLETLKNTRQARLRYLAEILKRARQDILFFAVLLHDIGKSGYCRNGGSHEDAGYKMLKAVMERFGIEHQDRKRIQFLVRNHIVLSKLALNRDSEAVETVTQLAELVENEENLDSLYLMTYADMTAVNPVFWTDWKAYLFHDIYVRTKDHLHGIRAKQYMTSDRMLQGFIESMPDRYVISSTSEIVQADYHLAARAAKEELAIAVNKRPDNTAEIVVAAKDKRGLFSKIVGVLSSRGLNILRARIYTSNKALALDKILLSNWSSICWEGLEEQLKEDLYKAIVMDTRIGPERGFLKPLFAGKRLENFIEIDNETSSIHTLLELQLPDRIGLLFDISEQLFKYGIDITSAVINTEDGVARDVFYLQYNGGKLTADFVMKILSGMYNSEIKKTEAPADGQ